MGRMTGRSEERGEGEMGVSRAFGLDEKEILQNMEDESSWRRGRRGKEMERLHKAASFNL